MSRLLQSFVALALVWLCMAAAATAVDRVAGARPQPPPDPPIRFWYALPEPQGARFEALLRRYAQEHARVRLEPRNFASAEELRAALLKGGEQPHLALIDATWQAELIQAGRLIQAEEWMDRTGAMTKVILKADNFPIMWAAVQHDGKAWTLPAFATGHALLYDSDMLTQGGVKIAPRTWAELLLDAKLVHKKLPQVWGFALSLDAAPRETGAILQLFAEAAGAAVPGATAWTLTDAPYAAALQFWVDLVEKYHVASVPVDRPRTAMFVGSLADLLTAQAQGRHLTATPLPKMKTQAADLDLYAVALMNTDPQLAQRNWQMALWAVEFQQMLEWSTETPYLPANKQVTLSPGYYQYLEAHPGVRSFLAQLRAAHTAPALAAWPRILETLAEATHAAVEKKQPVRDALAAADQRARAMVQPPAVPLVKPAGSSGR